MIFTEFLVIFYSDEPKISFSSSKNTANSSVMKGLINKVFPNVKNGYSDKYGIARRAMLTPRNESVDKINEVIMSSFPGQGKTHLTADTVAEDDLKDVYPTDFLNSITLQNATTLNDTQDWCPCHPTEKFKGRLWR